MIALNKIRSNVVLKLTHADLSSFLVSFTNFAIFLLSLVVPLFRAKLTFAKRGFSSSFLHDLMYFIYALIFMYFIFSF